MVSARIKTMLYSMTAILIAGSIMTFPKVSVDASLRGLNLWWNVVFPSLLPFFIVSEILIGIGVVSFIGVLLEPIMRPIFRVPGVGGFVFVMGLASGFPAGAKITSRLYQEKKLTKTEAERLASFTNFSNPLFMFGAVAYGFFHQASLGIILALSHYFGNITVGLLMRFYKYNDKPRHSLIRDKPNILIHALKKLHHERLKNKQPIGKMLGDAVHSSVMTLLMVGGFIILFSVINQLLTQVHINDVVAAMISHILIWFKLSPQLSHGIVPGLFEITIGAKTLSTAHVPLIEKVMMTSFVLGFSGFSIQAQVASILADAKLSFKPFFFGRVFHGIISTIFAMALFKMLYENSTMGKAMAVFSQHSQHLYHLSSNYHQISSLITLGALCLFIMINSYRGLKTK